MSLKGILDTKAGWGMTLMRIPVGVVFLGHGLPKYGWMGEGGGLEGTANFLQSLGLPAPTLMAILAGGAEIFGGAALIVGLFTRFWALSLAITMAVAIFAVHFDNGLLGQGGYQWALVLFACSLALLLDGPGKASIDKAIANGMRR